MVVNWKYWKLICKNKENYYKLVIIQISALDLKMISMGN